MKSKFKILVVNGPNLNLLGEREPDVYGYETLDDVNQKLLELAEKLEAELEFFQSNHEGFLVDFLHDHRKSADGVIINPGALTHYSYALHDAIAGIQLPTVEVHISDIKKREEFRRHSVIEPIAIKQISGLGINSYMVGLDYLVKFLQQKAAK